MSGESLPLPATVNDVLRHPFERGSPRNAPIAATPGPALTLPDAAAADGPLGPEVIL